MLEGDRMQRDGVDDLSSVGRVPLSVPECCLMMSPFGLTVSLQIAGRFFKVREQLMIYIASAQ